MIQRVIALLWLASIGPAVTAADLAELETLNADAQTAHGKRNLGDSTPLYKRLLAADPPAAGPDLRSAAWRSLRRRLYRRSRFSMRSAA